MDRHEEVHIKFFLRLHTVGLDQMSLQIGLAWVGFGAKFAQQFATFCMHQKVVTVHLVFAHAVVAAVHADQFSSIV